MGVYAVIVNGVVTNVVVWDGVSAYNSGGTMVNITAVSPQPAIGWTYNGTTFTPAS